MRQAKPGVVFVAAIVALMGIGMGYAHWSEVITITGIVNTGEIDLTPSYEGWTDDDKQYCTVNGDIEGNTLTVTIDKAYPCITVTIKFDIHNDGTIPAGLYKWTVTYDDTTLPIFDASNIGNSIIRPTMTEGEVEQALEDYVETTLGLGDYVDVEIDFQGSNFWQIDPGQEPHVIITIHFLENLPQDESYSFTMNLEYWNWNEVGYL